MSVKGYKVFNPDWTCRGFQYAVGQTFSYEGEIGVCEAGFRFCTKIADCFNYYPFNSSNKVAEIEAVGDVITDGDKSITNEIKIIREISWHEVLELANTGKDCTGYGNTGNRNTGDHNTGDHNTGNRNTGNYNTGDHNTGNRNTGDHNTGNRNTGNYNTGYRNTGNRNTGNYNTGYRNTGDHNTGYYNTGDRNTGYCNSGYCNTGDHNTGNRNIGYCNSGDRNTGYCNSGYCNTGDWNSCDFSTGFFNSISQPLYAFNKPLNIEIEEFYCCKGLQILNDNFSLTQWIADTDMTNEEKKNHPEHKTTGGYLKVFDFQTACKIMWEKLTKEERKEVCRIPNFDADVFEEITGIDVGGV